LNIAFELTDGFDFVNHLSLLCNCVMVCLNIRSLSKNNAVVTFIFILLLVLQDNAATKLRCMRWKILLVSYLQIICGYDAKKVIKIGQHLTKLQ